MGSVFIAQGLAIQQVLPELTHRWISDYLVEIGVVWWLRRGGSGIIRGVWVVILGVELFREWCLFIIQAGVCSSSHQHIAKET